MQLAILYVSTAVVFLALDAVMLTLVLKPLFTQHIGSMMLEEFRVAPAAAFYAFYVAGLLYLVSWPALKAGAPIWLPAAVIGAMAYGTYEFTSYAIMKDWHWSLMVVDTSWGTFVTALSAWAGVSITRALT